MRRVSFDTALGRCAITWHEAGLTGFELPQAAALESDDASSPNQVGMVVERVQRHLEGSLQDFSDLPYDFTNVAAFDLSVLKATLGLKAGQTCCYGEIATAIGRPPSVSRAVGSALGANRWPLLIPCHRVVAANGKMTGFSGPGGIKTKLRLLAIEGAQWFSE